MKKVLLILFAMFAMFSFSGCSTKIAYNQKYTADLVDTKKVKDEKKIYLCISDPNYKMEASHMVYDSRTYIMEDNVPQRIMKDFLSQYFVNIEEVNCNRDNFATIKKEPLISVFGTDSGISLSGASFFVESNIFIKNNGKISEKATERKYVSGIEANSVEYHSVFTGDTRMVIGANRSIFKSLENEKNFLVENLR